MSQKKSLLEKYAIPIGHLDFDYIKACKNGREMEKIVQILRSGQEGYFPDLTKCAEEKLKELKPDSRHFRLEHEIERGIKLDEMGPMLDWNRSIKELDERINEVRLSTEENLEHLKEDYPPVRESGKISGKTEDVNKKQEEDKKIIKNKKPIAATDYAKWDRFNPDDEILRMDLEEERKMEEVERKKNKLSSAISKNPNEEPKLPTEVNTKINPRLTEIEKQRLSEEFRLRGNECFRAGEYQNAKMDYTRAIKTLPEKSATAYNNRAVANIKLKLYEEAIEDCKKCLGFEPNNIKALLRLAEANSASGKKRESYEVYHRVIALDPTNVIANNAIRLLKSEIGDQPPSSATRLLIHECNSKDVKPVEKIQTSITKPSSISTDTTQSKSLPSKKKADTIANSKPPPKDYDLADLVVPNRIVKSKLATAAEMIKKLQPQRSEPNTQKSVSTNSAEKATPPDPMRDFRFRMPTDGSTPARGRPLIEEI